MWFLYFQQAEKGSQWATIPKNDEEVKAVVSEWLHSPEGDFYASGI